MTCSHLTIACLVVSKKCVWETTTTEKEIIMPTIIFSFFFIAIVLVGLWYHDVRHPPEEQAMQTMQTERNRRAIKDGLADLSKELLVEVPVATKR